MHKIPFLLVCLLLTLFQVSAQTTENLDSYRPKFDTKTPLTNTTPQGKEAIKPTFDITKSLNEKLDSIAERNKVIKFAQGFRIIVYSGTNKKPGKKYTAFIQTLIFIKFINNLIIKLR